MEQRKLKEIEHSRIRRLILQGFERSADTHNSCAIRDFDTMIKDKKNFNHYFSNMKFYSVTEKSENFKKEWLSQRCKPGIKILDFACGNGENALFAAGCGAEATGIDISPEGIANAAMNAKKYQLAKLCKFFAMDGEKMEFEDNSFDFGVEYGALHHVDLPKALAELARVLKPSGGMICIEALRHNPLIHSYRKLTPHLRTEWEVQHILGVEDLKTFRQYFHEVDVKFFHLTALALVPLRKLHFFPKLLKIFNKIDEFLLSSKLIGKYAWIMVVEISKPKK
jgi:ubiquinone/menaquinone biosynthesis C-methylase UbiE